MVEDILSTYSDTMQPFGLQSFGNAGGFSGAQIWKVDTSIGFLCVRRWPQPHPSVEQLRWIHGVLVGVKQMGCSFIPAPIANCAGNTIVVHAGSMWEVAPWMPGIADMRSEFTTQKIRSASRALAEFHVAAANNLADGSLSQPVCQPSPGMRERYRSALQLQVELAHYRSEMLKLPDSQTRVLCAEILDLAAPELQRLPSLIQPILGQTLPLQPCIRDIWHQHVLFDGDQLTGIVDFGAMRVESVALDLARLLGSLALCHPDVWQMGMLAYESVRPLSSMEIRTMRCAGVSSCVLSGLNWVRWLAVEQRMFEKMDLVHVRLREIRDQLRSGMSFSFKNGE